MVDPGDRQMTAAEVQAWIGVLVQVGTFVCVVYGSWRSYRNGRSITHLGHEINSMKDELIISTAKASDLEGEKRGIAIGAAQAVVSTTRSPSGTPAKNTSDGVPSQGV